MYYIYVLMEDGDGTMFSSPKPTGESVKTVEEAQEWVEGAAWLGQRAYRKVYLPD